MKQKTKLRKGDEVQILIGRSKGSVGKIEKFENDFSRVFVSGVNIYKKHVKASGNQTEGGIVDLPMSIDISNVAMLDPKSKKPSRLGYKVSESGSKVRIAKLSGLEI